MAHDQKPDDDTTDPTSEARGVDVTHDVSSAVAQLAAAQQQVASLPPIEPLTEETYEARRRSLSDAAEEARQALNAARSRYQQITDSLRDLRVEWQAQQADADPTTENASGRPFADPMIVDRDEN
ncbi:hypothetical protein [Streptomyces sp. NPDC007088]|uniref:hypothetical protein n=1 Tax=Streptomyces sp. NPDC007088 TaxID=3364773 RepID=UPI0036AE4D78